MKEIWKDIIGYEGYYQVSNQGNIKSMERIAFNSNRILKAKNIKPQNSGAVSCQYKAVTLRKDGGKEVQRVHRLVALTFIKNNKNKPHINHINSNPSDNRVENLEWCTSSENSTHAFRFGNRKPSIGESHGMSKLTNDEVSEIRQINSMYGFNGSVAAKEYGITRQRIWQITHIPYDQFKVGMV